MESTSWLLMPKSHNLMCPWRSKRMFEGFTSKGTNTRWWSWLAKAWISILFLISGLRPHWNDIFIFNYAAEHEQIIKHNERTQVSYIHNISLIQLVHRIYQDVLTTTEQEIQGLKLTSMNNIQFGFKVVQSFNNLRIKKKISALLNVTCVY